MAIDQSFRIVITEENRDYRMGPLFIIDPTKTKHTLSERDLQVMRHRGVLRMRNTFCNHRHSLKNAHFYRLRIAIGKDMAYVV